MYRIVKTFCLDIAKMACFSVTSKSFCVFLLFLAKKISSPDFFRPKVCAFQSFSVTLPPNGGMPSFTAVPLHRGLLVK